MVTSPRSTRYKVAVSAASFCRMPELLHELEALGVEVIPNDRGRPLTATEVVAFLQHINPDALIVGTEPISRAVLEVCPRLKVVSKYGVGLDNIDEAEISRRGIGLGWTPGVNRLAVAELVLAFALGHFRNVIVSINRMREGKWVKNGGFQLSSQQVGIVGLGHTGSEVARLLQPFGTRVVYSDVVDRTGAAFPLNAQSMEYGQLLATSDIVTFHVPLTAETRGMLGSAQLPLLKGHALVINTSRGPVVDFELLCQSVKDGKLGGFAADVFPVEPADLSAWSDCERLYFTPHIAGNSREAVLEMGRAAIRGVQEHLGLS